MQEKAAPMSNQLLKYQELPLFLDMGKIKNPISPNSFVKQQELAKKSRITNGLGHMQEKEVAMSKLTLVIS